MPRQKKDRQICFEPANRIFRPDMENSESAEITLEELEAMRLVDREGFDQNEAAVCMGVSRATFQRMLYSARYKLADGLLAGKNIVLSGGSYRLAKSGCACRKICRPCRFHKKGDVSE